jgi:hypothetical protein
MAEVALSQLGSELREVAAATRAVTIALASFGIPLTISRLCCPDANAEMLKASRSAICVGAAQVIFEVDAGDGVKGAGYANTVCVTVDVAVVDTVTVIVSVNVQMEDAGEPATNEADEKHAAESETVQQGVVDSMDATGITSELAGRVCVVVPRTSTREALATEPIEVGKAAKLLLAESIGAGAASEKDKTPSVRR